MQENLPKGWKMVRLGDVCDINPSKPELPNESSVTFLPMNAVSDNGEILNPQIKQYKDVQKGYTGFVENDVLFAKITPCMENGKGAIARDLNNSVGFGSTEFHVIRPSRKILPEIIFRYLSLKHIRKFAAVNMTGSAGQKRVPQSFLNAVKIPLPPLPTQYKLVEILEEADNLRKLRQQADEKMQDLIPSLFIQMFGDPAKNPKGWEEKKLGDLSNIITKGTTPTTYGHKFQDHGIKFLKIENINDEGQFIFNNLQFISGETNRFLKRSILGEGDILFSIAGALGRCAIVKEDILPANINQALALIRIKKGLLNQDYLVSFLRSLSAFGLFSKLKVGVAQLNLSLTQVKDFNIPLPPLPLQQEFAERVEEIEAVKTRQAESKKKLDELFNSLMQRAFSGKLVA